MKSDSYIFTIHHQLFYETTFWGVNFLKKMSAKVFDNYVEMPVIGVSSTIEG